MTTQEVSGTPKARHAGQRVCALLSGIAVAMLTVAIACADTSPDVKPFAASTLGHWRLDEDGGTQGARTIGARPVHLRGGARWCVGRYGMGIDLDGQSGCVQLGDLGSAAEATIAFWMKPRNVEKADYQGLVTTPSWGKGMLHLPIRKGRIDAYLHLGGGARAQVQSGPVVNGRWTHIGITISAITERMVLYVDGVKTDASSTPGLGEVVLDDMVAGFEGTTRYFDGSLDEILILSRALSPRGMAYLAGTGGALPAGDRLAGYPAGKEEERVWTMREGAPVQGSLVAIRDGNAILLVGEKELPVALSDLAETEARYARCLASGSVPPAVSDSARTRDWRNLEAGHPIPDEGYCDQPYVVITRDGAWLCTLTTGKGHEGQGGQHFVSTISKDRGKTWGPLVDIEPADGPEASYGVPLIVPSGRVYAFYTYNGDRVRTLPGSTREIRADMLGWYCYKYSDDSGNTWSERRRIPVRSTACDHANQWQGEVRIFWGIDKPKISDSGARFAFTKLGKYMLDNGEGWMMHSDNILAEPDVSKIRWKTLPGGEHGLRVKEFGSVQEEHNHVTIGPDRLYMVYRTTHGYPAHTYSSDGGHTWTVPEHMTYAPGGRKIKNPRACPKLWRCTNGKYLFWFHNHSGRDFNGRNPAWVTGGVVRDGKLHWSEPEVLLYEANPKTRMSYPDLVEQDGRYWVTETQKSVARVHEIPADLLEGLWGQLGGRTAVAEDAVLSLGGDAVAAGKTAALPELPDLAVGGGFSLDVWLQMTDVAAGQTILDSRDQTGCGFALSTGKDGSLVLSMGDGRHSTTLTSDPDVLTAGNLHHAVFIVDGGPCIISVVCDAVLNDGGTHRQFGWGRFDPRLRSPSGGDLRVAADLKGTVKHVRLYSRYLRTSEAVGNFRAGCPAVP